MRNSIPHFVSGLLVILSSSAGAQVGHSPSNSPYYDLQRSQELTLIGGQYHAHRDPADVGPQSGLLVGAHYEYRASGPLYITGELARISSERRVINPFRVGDARELGNVPLQGRAGVFTVLPRCLEQLALHNHQFADHIH